jgi:D-alanyl-D-alanine carboxypeptidase
MAINFQLICLMMFLCTSCHSKENVIDMQARDDKFQIIIDSLRISSRTNGVQFCIIDSLGVTKSWTSGYQDKKNSKHLITNNSTFRIGSTTKLFTGFLIMKLVQESRISLDDKLSNWYPDFPNSDSITIRNLLMHKSGTTEILRFPKFLMECVFTPKKIYVSNDLIQFVASKGLKKATKPNKKYEYSNTNYILLGAIAETIYKKDYQELIDSISGAFSLANTSYIVEKTTNSNLVNGYDKDLIPFPWGYVNQPDNTSWTSLASASGGIISNAKDLCSFFSEDVKGNSFNENIRSEIFHFESCKHDGLPEIKGIGLGIFQFEVDGIEYWGHEGQMIGSESLVLYCPRNKLTFCVTGNRSAFKDKYQMISKINGLLLKNE